MSEDQYQTITFELPLKGNALDKKGLTVDSLFTALDHARSYHGYSGDYDESFKNLEGHLKSQAFDQLE